MEVAGAGHLTVIFHDFFDDKVAWVPDEPVGNEVAQMILNAIAATLGVRLQSDPESNLYQQTGNRFGASEANIECCA